jgi:hypothetical protein
LLLLFLRLWFLFLFVRCLPPPLDPSIRPHWNNNLGLLIL